MSMKVTQFFAGAAVMFLAMALAYLLALGLIYHGRWRALTSETFRKKAKRVAAISCLLFYAILLINFSRIFFD